MNYMKALSVVLSLNDMRGDLEMLETIRGQNRRLERKSPGDITFDDLSVFNNRHIDRAKRELRQAEQKMSRCLRAQHEWPRPPTPNDYFQSAGAVARRKGPDSREFRSAMNDYRDSLIKFGIEVTNPIRGRLSRQNKQKLERRKRTARNIRDYSREVAEMFRKLARLPYPAPTTALQAEFVSYERHMRDIIGLASRIHTGYDRLIQRNEELTREIRSRARTYDHWVRQFDRGETERGIRASLG